MQPTLPDTKVNSFETPYGIAGAASLESRTSSSP